MTLKTNIDTVKFLQTVNTCKDDVLFQTPEGDSLNLKSLLSQYLLASVLCSEELTHTGQIVCSAEDKALLLPFCR